jgi:hypothetical protein
MWRGLPRAGRGGGLAAGPVDRAVAQKLSSYRDIVRGQPPSVVLTAFAFESLGELHADALEVMFGEHFFNF